MGWYLEQLLLLYLLVGTATIYMEVHKHAATFVKSYLTLEILLELRTGYTLKRWAVGGLTLSQWVENLTVTTKAIKVGVYLAAF